MILSKAYDVEILPNFFSITIVDVNDYLKVFSDSCEINKKGKKSPIPLVQKYSVAEIKNKLHEVKKVSFYITDTDDSQLFKMIACLNNMNSHVNEQGIAIRTDMFGYNSMNYDKLMVAAFLMYATNTNTTKDLITKLYDTSKKIIDLQDTKLIIQCKMYQFIFYSVYIIKIYPKEYIGYI